MSCHSLLPAPDAVEIAPVRQGQILFALSAFPLVKQILLYHVGARVQELIRARNEQRMCCANVMLLCSHCRQRTLWEMQWYRCDGSRQEWLKIILQKKNHSPCFMCVCRTLSFISDILPDVPTSPHNPLHSLLQLQGRSGPSSNSVSAGKRRQ